MNRPRAYVDMTNAETVDQGSVDAMVKLFRVHTSVDLRDNVDRLQGVVNAVYFLQLTNEERLLFLRASATHCEAMEKKYPIEGYPI